MLPFKAHITEGHIGVHKVNGQSILVLGTPLVFRDKESIEAYFSMKSEIAPEEFEYKKAFVVLEEDIAMADWEEVAVEFDDFHHYEKNMYRCSHCKGIHFRATAYCPDCGFLMRGAEKLPAGVDEY